MDKARILLLSGGWRLRGWPAETTSVIPRVSRSTTTSQRPWSTFLSWANHPKAPECITVHRRHFLAASLQQPLSPENLRCPKAKFLTGASRPLSAPVLLSLSISQTSCAPACATMSHCLNSTWVFGHVCPQTHRLLHLEFPPASLCRCS